MATTEQTNSTIRSLPKTTVVSVKVSVLKPIGDGSETVTITERKLSRLLVVSNGEISFVEIAAIVRSRLAELMDLFVVYG